MKFPVYELVDRYAIALVKNDKLPEGNKDELEFYENQLNAEYKIDIIKHLITDLVFVHEKIWSMENDFKKRRIDKKPLEEIGQLALEVRDWNEKRFYLKNRIADKLGSALKEIKDYNGFKYIDLVEFNERYYYHTKPWGHRKIVYLDFSEDYDKHADPNFVYKYVEFLNNKNNYKPDDILVLDNPYQFSHIQKPLINYLNHFYKTNPNPLVYLTSKWKLEDDNVQFPVYVDLFHEQATHNWTIGRHKFYGCDQWKDSVRHLRHFKVTYTSTKDYPWRRYVYKMLQETDPDNSILAYSCIDSCFDYSYTREKDFDLAPLVFPYYTDDFLSYVSDLPGIPTKTLGDRIDFDALPKEILHNSYTNVIVDTFYHPVGNEESRPFFSEKVFNAIAHRQLFFYVGMPNSLPILKDKGYHLFEEILDLSYDSIFDPQQRIIAFTNSIKKFINRDIEEIQKDYITMMDKLEENFQRISNSSFEEKMDNAIRLALQEKK